MKAKRHADAESAKRLVRAKISEVRIPAARYTYPMPNLPTDPGCIFCKIVAGEIPCHRVYEDDQVLAFLDVNPLSEGHTLVIPKGHYSALDRLPEDDAAAIGAALPKLSRAINEATGATGWNILQNNGGEAGQDVFHVHFHIIPRKPGTDRKRSVMGEGLAATTWLNDQINHAEAQSLAELIRTRTS